MAKFEYRPRVDLGPMAYWGGSADRHGNPLAPAQLVSPDDARAQIVFAPRAMIDVDDPVACEFFTNHAHFRPVTQGRLR
jgi:hypothetical protein